ncbi:F-box/kelch-repeat protein SKIP6 [Apostasia shenzhenica]|uniref:F-box/kelch-repeat protein SKIP6 n=1 Tax=Apostasia shenzhenica TaxID=1088818 RepID=A0A2I0A6Z4_9ASPA|nr:F-box/kelch-repeat protein SKIP6 [Apostasia shenzhenica]
MADPLLMSPALPPQMPRLIPALPDDLAILCIARVPQYYHPCLAAVSRSWRSALRSPLLFAIRLEVDAAQPFLLINVRTPTDQSRWYLLDRLRQSPAASLLPLRSPPLPTALGSAVVALGPTLFLLGGSIHGIPSSAVQIFDARFNRWRLGPPMSSAREFAAAGAICGRIYAVGGCLPVNDYWAEEFESDTERWRRVPSPPEIREKWMHGNAVINGKLLAVADRGGLIYDPAAAMDVEQEKAWGPLPTALDLGWRGRAAVVGGVLYSYDFLGKIKGYDLAYDDWMPVDGVDKELPKFLHGATLANFGDLLCLVWEGRQSGRVRSKEMEIACAGIRISRTRTGGLQGSVEWSESVVLAIPKGSSIAHCISLEF